MNLNNILNEEKKLVELDKKTLSYLRKETNLLVELLRKEIGRKGEVFVGGSFAKGTLLKTDNYDIDIYARFDWRIENISGILEKSIKKICGKLDVEMKKVHGSRDYFRLKRGESLTFEIIPVYKINKPREARNVTDLSYFHVNYVRKKLKENNIGKEILIAKKFCQSQGVYGAEDYIRGFSGYGLECLMIHYKSFEKALRGLVKVQDRLIIDSAKAYKNKNDVLFSLNESKLQSPVILVDPTWKERNALSALSKETFMKFQESARKFLDKPSLDFFELKELNLSNFKKLKGEFLHLKISTNRQEGNIAGTKMKKFSMYLEREMKRYFDILKSKFAYDGGQFSDLYLVLNAKKEVVRQGPPVKIEKHAKEFRKRNKNIFSKGGYLYSRQKINFTGKDFMEKFAKNERKKLGEMGIVDIKIM